MDLARRVSPQEVVRLESEWGDYLALQKAYDAAINHYIEAGLDFVRSFRLSIKRILILNFFVTRESLKAVDAAINSRQWKKAVDILATQESSTTVSYYKKIADHFAGIQEFDVFKLLIF